MIQQLKRDSFNSLLENCKLCPRECNVNRLAGELGFCKSGAKIKVASSAIHRGEEPPISGTHGSGTIFFSNCNSQCVYCQNYPISQLGYGTEYSIEEFIKILFSLQNKGAHNINLVTPVPYTPMIKEAVYIAKKNGLKLPIIMNILGWESLYFADLVLDFTDVFLVDVRYADDQLAEKYSNIKDYVSINKKFLNKIIAEIPQQKCDKDGIIQAGIIIRHLVLPNNLNNSIQALRNLKEWFGTEIYISLMNQYFPAYKASDYPELNRRLTIEEWTEILTEFKNLGFKNGWIQEFETD
ncbi:radical SAM protein [Candidatus Dependentiae bacterium]|nr:radical SAM protein [Candidatus Dependentiae bacterium]